MVQQKQVGVLLFEEFETLDVFGPVEIFGVTKGEYSISFYSELGGLRGRKRRNEHGTRLS